MLKSLMMSSVQYVEEFNDVICHYYLFECHKNVESTSPINALLKDFHSHMAQVEVMGYLGGTFDSNTKGKSR